MMKHPYLLLIIFILHTSLSAHQKIVDLTDKHRWHLSSGEGKWQVDPLTGEQCLTVTGSGKKGDSNYWWFDYPFQAKQIYKISCRVRTSSGAKGSHILIGSNLANRDVWAQNEWQQQQFVFTMPCQFNRAYLRFGQWHVRGTVWFRDIKVVPVQAVHRQHHGYQLGSGERIENGLYRADYTFQGQETNSSRCLFKHNGFFNTNRWDLYEGDVIIFRHLLKSGAFDQKSGTIKIKIGHYSRGKGIVEASRDGKLWRRIGMMNRKGEETFNIPAAFYPTDLIYIRFRVEGLLARMQLYSYHYQAQVPVRLPQFAGKTNYVEILHQIDDIAVHLESIGSATSQHKESTVLRLKNKSTQRNNYEITLESGEKKEKKRITIGVGKTRRVKLPIVQTPEISPQTTITIKQTGKRQSVFTAQAEIETPYLQWTNYGNLIGKFGNITLWWTDGTRKISKNRPPPTNPVRPAIKFFAAKNEYEPMQLVLCPENDLDNVNVKVTPLRNMYGDVIPTHHIEILLVDYVFIEQPTDAVGTVDYWPDPLPPIIDSFSIKKDQNQPLWILIKTPQDVQSGDYTGSIILTANGWERRIPIHLFVWDFALPKKNHLQSSFGLDFSLVKKYHHLSESNDLNNILDKYFQNFADHRISPYNPFLLQDIKTTFNINTLTFRLDFKQFDLAAKKYFTKFGFSSFRVPIKGLASATDQFGSLSGNRQYQKLMTNYLSQLQRHFEQLGILDKAYIQIIDEPEQEDYDFVKEKMAFIHHAAPKLTRMVTEQPEPELYGYIDLWCPLTSNYDHKISEQRRAKGDKFWWYICTATKEPYCSLFIDHYGVELRTWIWQAWKYNIDGILIWQTNYWTSNVAFPKPKLQNPYKDPMSYKTGYGLKLGEKVHWGNGDGRFLYPPKAVFMSNTPCYEKPVNSIRWEMLREGMEDYEYFWLLQDLIKKVSKKGGHGSLIKKAKILLEVPDDVTISLIEFSKTPEAIYKHRLKIAEMIERLNDILN